MLLSHLGWTDAREARFQPLRARGLVPARVVVEFGESYRLVLDSGERLGALAGGLRHRAAGREDLPGVGDWVAALDREAEGRSTIVEVLPRTTALVRRAAGRTATNQVLAANVDFVLVVAALDADFNPRRLERTLAVVWESGAQPVLVLNKADLCEDVDACRAEAGEVALGVPVHAIAAREGLGLEGLGPYLAPGRTIAFIGSSGVGKSTLVNRLLGEERQAVREVRAGDGRGQHTTTHRELLVLPGGAILIDTPGLREIGLAGAEQGLEVAFADVEELAASCRFRDCLHDAEPGCAVRDAVDPERLASWRKLQREAAYAASRTDERLRRQRAQEFRRFGRMVRAATKKREERRGP